MMSSRRSLVIFLVICAAIVGTSLGFTSGYGVGIWQSQASHQLNLLGQNRSTNSTAALDPQLFWKVWDVVQSSYVGQPVADTNLFYGAVSGIAQSVHDPYTEFFTPEQTKKFNENITGQFDGIGAEIGMKDDQLVVIAPLKGSPADAAGLMPDDAIVKIDGTDTTGMTIDTALSLIRGAKGTSVVLSIYRTGDASLSDIKIKRDTIQIPSVTYELNEYNGKHIGVITLNHVEETSSKDFSKIVQQVLLDSPDGLILDMRNNPGGLLTECVNIASNFITSGTIVTEKFSDGHTQDYPATGTAPLADQPKLMVLVNQGTASAAEIIAGALQDYDRATVIGKTTFGKGSVQNYQTFPDGSSLKVTVAKWFTPKDRTIDKTGITPDVEVDRTAADVQAQADPQFDKAIELLTN